MTRFKKTALLAFLPLVVSDQINLSNKNYEGAVTGEFKSIDGNLDGNKLNPYANNTSFDWWYFDALSASSNANVVFGFYNAGPQGMGQGAFNDSNLWFQIQGTFDNGTAFGQYYLPATEAIIKTDSEGLSAEWTGTGASFRATSLNSSFITYVATLNIPTIGIYGSVTLYSLAPPHYPCGPNIAGVNEEILPNIGWANAVPDAHAFVDLVINGTKLQFGDGIGYHDKNWGTAPLQDYIETWYWGHARIGPYSLVWFDSRPPTGSESFSGYVAKDGKIIQASCANEAVVVRPWGANDTYPPQPATGPMQGLKVVFDLGNGESLTANITSGPVVAEIEDFYIRNTGSVSATIKPSSGQEQKYHGGRAFYEEFKYSSIQ